jgi:hypothetical protein
MNGLLSQGLRNPPKEAVHGPLALKMSPPYLSDEEIQNLPMSPQGQAMIDTLRSPFIQQNPYLQLLLNYLR